MVVAWLQDYPSPGAVIHPLVYDIKSLLSGCISSNIRHIYSEMNSAANWIASFIAHNFGQGCFNDYFLLSMFFRDILCSNFLGCIHTRIIRLIHSIKNKSKISKLYLDLLSLMLS